MSNAFTADNESVTNQSTPVRSNHFPKLGQAWGLVGILFLSQIVGAIPAAGLGIAAGFTNLTWLKPVGEFLAYVISLGLTIWYALRKREPNSLSFRSAPAATYPVAALGVVALGVILEPLISAIPMPEALKELIAKLFTKDVVFTAVIAAPILEEILFRGIILDGLLTNYSPAKAIIWSAVIFGFIHLIPTQAINAMFLGMALGWVYYRTRSLYLCMFLHFVNNGLSSLTLLLDDTMDMSENTTRTLVGNDALYVGLLVLCAGICYGCYAYLNRVFSTPTIIPPTW